MSDSSYKKWQISIFSAFIFILVVHPFTQKTLGKISEKHVLILSTLMYILLVRGSMNLKIPEA